MGTLERRGEAAWKNDRPKGIDLLRRDIRTCSSDRIRSGGGSLDATGGGQQWTKLVPPMKYDSASLR